jgi:hypothetical protein
VKIKSFYKTRPVRFLEVAEVDGWKIKLYSISVKSVIVNAETIAFAKRQLPGWLKKASAYKLDTYKVATLILHEGKEGCFAIISWWTDENMLQLYVYLSSYNQPTDFKLYSDKGIVSCVWEMAVLWFERNAWVNHVLMKAGNPDLEAYLNEQLNADV